MIARRPRVTQPGRWADLAERVGSGLIILVAGTALLVAPRPLAQAGIAALYGGLMWELTRLVGDVPAPASRARLVGAMVAAVLAAAFFVTPWALPILAVPLAVGWWGTLTSLRTAYLIYSLVMALAAWGVWLIRDHMGLPTALWIVAIVVLSDVLGYFVGRSLGGPKFWPAISPKKTWSGTVAGWVGAVMLGLMLVAAGQSGWSAVLLGPVLAFGGQMGDIVESWIKRRAGVKDSSNLIPGHGGLMDRFDAMSGSVAIATLLGLAGLLPVIGA